MENNITYELDENHTDKCGIRITSGKYKGVTFVFEEIKPLEEDDKFQLKYEIISDDPKVQKQESEEDFVELVKNICTDIIEKTYQHIQKEKNNTTDDTTV